MIRTIAASRYIFLSPSIAAFVFLDSSSYDITSMPKESKIVGSSAYRNLRLNRVDVYLGSGVYKIGVETKYIVIIDISSWWNLP